MIKRIISIFFIMCLLCTGCVDGTNHDTDVIRSETVITVTPTPEATASPTPSPTPLDKAEEMLSAMTTEEKVAQLFFIRPEQITDNGEKSRLSSDMKNALSYREPGGFVFFADNIKSKEQLMKYTSDLKEACRFMPFIAVDEEGGTVARLASSPTLHIDNVGNMGGIGKTGDTEKAYSAGHTIGAYLSEYGFNLNFAPVADVNTNPKNRVIGNRAFGSDPYLVSDMAGEMSRGLHDEGILSVFKHFPGHGDTSDDTHTGYAASYKTWDELLSCELIPYINNIGNADMIMVSHITLPNVTDDSLPASLSHEIITDRLRGELGYDGIIITDGMEMGAVTRYYSSGEAAYLAFCAGCDIILLPEDYGEAYDYISAAVKDGRISEDRLNESVLKILRLKLSAAQ